MFKKKQLVLVLLGIAASQGAYAQTASGLEDVTVTSTRTERTIGNTPNTVTRINRSRIEEQNPRDIKDLLQNEPGVSVRRGPARFSAALGATGRAGNEGINIRGIEGNRVMMLIDGVRLPNSFEFGAFATGRGDFLEVGGLKSVEILRGPSSIQFGSDGMAGVVNFTTLNPSDVYKQDHQGGLVGAGYDSVDRSWNSTAAWAGHNERYEGLILANYRQGHEVENQGTQQALNSDRTAPNPLDYDSQYVLAKGGVKIDADQRLMLTLESQRRHQTIPNVYTALPPEPKNNQATALYADDDTRRDRLSVNYTLDDINQRLMDKFTANLFWQQSEVTQFSREERLNNVARIRDNTYAQDMWGASTLFEKRLSGRVQQRISYGVDWSLTQLSGIRDGTIPPFGETFPNAPFPDTDYTLMGAFIQDEIDINQVSIIPALRFDYYKLDPKGTEQYLGETPTSLSDHAWTPRLGVIWRATDWAAPYVNWAKGYRAPTPDQVNNGFRNPASGYTSIGNPDLKAETVNSWELGLKGKVDGVSYAVAYFDNRYSDFISQQRVGGSMTPQDPTVYQYINTANADIHGVEVRAEWRIDQYWKTSLGVAYAKGETEELGVVQPLDTINPLELSWGLRYDQPRWGARVDVLYSDAKSRDDIPVEDNPLFASGSYTIVDLGAYWKPRADVTIHAGINNVFDKEYWRWSDVRGVASNSPVISSYTALGRNANISLKYTF